MSDRPLKYKWVVSRSGNPYVVLKNAAGARCSVMCVKGGHWRVFVGDKSVGQDVEDFSTIEDAFEYARSRLPD